MAPHSQAAKRRGQSLLLHLLTRRTRRRDGANLPWRGGRAGRSIAGGDGGRLRRGQRRRYAADGAANGDGLGPLLSDREWRIDVGLGRRREQHALAGGFLGGGGAPPPLYFAMIAFAFSLNGRSPVSVLMSKRNSGVIPSMIPSLVEEEPALVTRVEEPALPPRDAMTSSRIANRGID